MSTGKKLALIAAGYAFSVIGGLVMVALNEAFMPADIAQGSPGMVAFGDMILFVLVTGFLGLVPTWFLLKLAIEKAPRVLLACILLIAALGPASWLTMLSMASGASPTRLPEIVSGLFGFFIAFVAIPRIVAGPVMLVVEAMTFLMREGMTRALLAVVMLVEIVPPSLYVLHLTRAGPY
jgi:hypothetical protein